MTKVIYLAGGCFWGMQHFLQLIDGVTHTTVGFANGHTDNPTYKEVYTDTTGYAETVYVEYDPERVNLTTLLQFYFKAIDPESLNKQGEDEGTRYRTGVYYTDEADLKVIQEEFARQQQVLDGPILVELQPLNNFYPADEYHQDYLIKNPAGYCHLSPEIFALAKSYKSKKK